MENRIRTVYLGNAAPPEGLKDHFSENGKPASKVGELILWGERTDTKNEWIEQQVPHRFAYPIPTALFSRGRAVIVIEHWIDQFRVCTV